MAPKSHSSLPRAHDIATSAEFHYEQSKHNLDLIIHNEELRKLRLQNILLRDELDDVNQQLLDEAAHADNLQQDVDTWQNSAAEAEDDLERITNDLRSKTRELDNLRAEMSSLSHLNEASSTLLTEKLSLQRELGALRPELEHYRSQATANETLLSEKLSLQRQCASQRAELEDARRDISRIETQLRKGGSVDSALKEEFEALRQELAEEKKQRAHDAKGAATTAELSELQKSLSTEKRERSKADRAVQKAASEWEASKAVLEDKLDQFRDKLRATKETLKETQEELASSREAAATRKPASAAAAKNPRKRAADADATIGTPGDAGPAAKRNKRASSTIGEKSNFSITPLLKRTKDMSGALPAPRQAKAAEQALPGIAEDAEEPTEADAEGDLEPQPQDPDEPVPSIEPGTALNSPFTSRETSMAPIDAVINAIPSKLRPLGPASPSKSNLKAKPTTSATAGRKKAALISKLDIVVEGDEEEEEGQENAFPQPLQSKPAQSVAPKSKPRLSLKPKSLSTFTSFREGSVLQPRETSMRPLVQKKKRKLLGTAAKTIFDEDVEDDAAPAKARAGSIAFGGQRAFGSFAGDLGRMGGLMGGKRKGPLQVAEDGSVFSPLKKQRRAMAEAAKPGALAL